MWRIKGKKMKIFLIVVAVIIIFIVPLYLLLIMPRINGRPDTAPFEGWLYAHRGLHDNAGDAPENSMKAFRKAVGAGYGIELDVQLTKDRVPVVFHDGTLKRVCGAEGKVSDFTFEELQQFKLYDSKEKIPKLADVLKLVDGKIPMIVEYKSESTDISVCPVTDPILREYKGTYCIESFNPLIVAWYRKNRSEVLRGQLAEKLYSAGTKKNALNFVLEYLLLNFYARPDFIAYNHKHYDNLSRRIATGLYRNISVAYTIKNQEEYEIAKKHFAWFIFDSFIPEQAD